MGTKVWIGAAGLGGDDPAIATNWQGGVNPVAGDDWLLNHLAVRAMAGSAAYAATVFRHLTLTEGYKLGVGGGVGGYLQTKFTGTGGLVKIACAGRDLYLSIDANDVAFEGLGIGVGHFQSGTIAALLGVNASLNFGAAVITNGTLLGGRLAMNPGTAPTSLTLDGAELLSARSIATLDVSGGYKGQQARVTLSESAAITTLAEIRANAWYNHRAAANIANLKLHPGSEFTRDGASGDCAIAAGTLWRGSKRRFDVTGVTTSYNGSGGTAAFTLIGETSGSMNNDGRDGLEAA